MAKKNRQEVILVVDDSPDTLEYLHRSIEHMGFTVCSCDNAKEAIKLLEETRIDLVITDYHMPFVGGLDLIRHVRENYRDSEVMMITGYASVEGAIEAIKAGAEEYLSKPFTDEELEQAIERSLEKLCIRVVKKAPPSKNISKQYGILGESEGVKRIFNAIKKAASTRLPVLISGEVGTGKELVARSIHYESEKANYPFIPINCRNIPDSILENELFGFIQAESEFESDPSAKMCSGRSTRPGFLDRVEEGTIFLDEISETSPALQVKLLRALVSGEISSVGSNTVRPISCRIIASTSRDLIALAGKGSFREDLFFRLNVLNISIPPLRERGNDVILLAQDFFSRACSEAGRSSVPEFSERAYQILRQYPWPGNIRELGILMRSLAWNAEGHTIEVSDLPQFMRYNLAEESRLSRTMFETERDYIKEVLAKFGGNKTKAAEMLEIDRKTLREKLGRQSKSKNS